MYRVSSGFSFKPEDTCVRGRFTIWYCFHPGDVLPWDLPYGIPSGGGGGLLYGILSGGGGVGGIIPM